MLSVFLSSYRNTSESLGELKKVVEICACQFTCVSINNVIGTQCTLCTVLGTNLVKQQKLSIHY